MSQGTIEKPVLAHYPASPSKLQTYTGAVSRTQQELPTAPVQLSSYPSQLHSRPVQGSHQDRTYFVSQHLTLRREKCCTQNACRNSAGLSASCRVQRLADSGADRGGASQALCTNPPVPFCRCRGADWFTRKFGARS